MPTLFARFYNNGADLYQKAKEVAAKANFTIAKEDQQNGIMHLHKKVGGRTVHMVVQVGSGKERCIVLDIFPGDEGYYMDTGRAFIDGLKKVVW